MGRQYYLVVVLKSGNKGHLNTREIAPASLDLSFRQTSITRTEGWAEFLGFHHGIMPNEKHGLITEDFVKATPEQSALSVDSRITRCWTFKYIDFVQNNH